MKFLGIFSKLFILAYLKLKFLGTFIVCQKMNMHTKFHVKNSKIESPNG